MLLFCSHCSAVFCDLACSWERYSVIRCTSEAVPVLAPHFSVFTPHKQSFSRKLEEPVYSVLLAISINQVLQQCLNQEGDRSVASHYKKKFHQRSKFISGNNIVAGWRTNELKERKNWTESCLLSPTLLLAPAKSGKPVSTWSVTEESLIAVQFSLVHMQTR